jgi:choline kinase
MAYKLPLSYVVPTRPVNISKNDITIIILAANIGYGMKSYGPRSLININDKETVLEYQINLIKNIFPKSDIILVVGFWADRIIRRCPQGVRIVENPFYEETNEVEQLRLALNCTLTENVLVLKDNTIFNIETFKDISKDGSCLIYDSKNQLEKEDVGITVVNGYGTILSYNIPTKWCHIVYLANKDLKAIKSICNNKDNAKLYLFEALNILLHRIEKMKAIEPTNMEIIKIDNSRDLEKLMIK